MAMKEQILHFGADEHLVGTLTMPSTPNGEASPVIFLNAGIVHRIGPHRLHVKIARFLAELGTPSLRFDLTGLGDSRVHNGADGHNTDHEAQAVADIQAAMDATGKALPHAPNGFIAFGICSGADNAYRAALRDERLTGLMLLDPYAYDSPQARRSRIVKKATDLGRWMRFIERLTRHRDWPDVRPANEANNGRVHPPPEDFGAALQTLTDRGVDILALYTNSVEEQMTAPSHFHAVFKDFAFGDRLTVRFNGDSDHTYSTLTAQAALFGQLADWLTRRRNTVARIEAAAPQALSA